MAVAIIKRPEDDRYLLVSSAKDFGEFSGFLYPPGGKMEEGETVEETLKRELLEELGLTIEPIRQIAKTPGDIEGQETYWWECNIVRGEIVKSEEIAEVGYFSKQEIEELSVWPATKAFFRDYIDIPAIHKERVII